MKDRITKLIQGVVPTGSVLQRTVKSGIWVSATKLSSRLMQILMLIVLARLLAPKDFGIMGIALLTLSGLNRFTEIGLNAALIQQKATNVDDYLDTTWCLEAGRGILIVTGLFVLAPYIASFFDEPTATVPIQVIALSTLFFGFRNPAVVYFKKDLAFHKQFVYETSGGFIQFIVGVSYALVSPTVWALVFASVATSANKFVLSYVMHEYRPWPSFDIEKAKELIHYGKWITGSSIVGFLYSEGDDAFVGWLLTATALGYYQYAYRIADTPSSEVSGVISQITFPAYSRLQDDMDALRSALLETLRFTSFVTFPMAFGIALVAPSFVPAVLGPDWTPMITAMQILALYGLLHSITRNFGAVWKALGRPDYVTKLGMFRVLCIAALIWPATARWGIEGTALVVVGVYVFPMLPIDVYLAAKTVEGRSIQIYREYAYPFVAASVMFATLWYARTLVELSPLVEFLALVPAGAAIYIVTAVVLERQFDWGIERNIRMVVNGIRG
ncbi:lipopolysaccharide biosynthesis protein [Halalkalirubrum salinum]|uniref:lipopolysaccharide biosynthesis protein n=1 Tax=Halalkalirubrum salinum TaxID=2563889 RepID=UPI0010FBB033|nr:lipopolysaccharide biosynthesis protein [Halalkalirubrum salinum]